MPPPKNVVVPTTHMSTNKLPPMTMRPIYVNVYQAYVTSLCASRSAKTEKDVKYEDDAVTPDGEEVPCERNGRWWKMSSKCAQLDWI